jgi:transketolase
MAGGLALTGMRPIVHTFAPFLVERPFEQVKLDLGHQGVGAVLVSAGGSYDWPEGGETHFGHRDVALLDTLDGWTVHVPGHPAEAEALLRAAVSGDGRVYLRLGADSNATPRPTGPMAVLRRGARGTVVAVGPMADRVLAAVADLDVTVLYAATVRPFDAATLRATLDTSAVVLVEPYLRDTSTPAVSRALADVPHRVLGLGVGQAEARTYGSRGGHDALNGLDERGLRGQITEFLR